MSYDLRRKKKEIVNYSAEKLLYAFLLMSEILYFLFPHQPPLFNSS